MAAAQNLLTLSCLFLSSSLPLQTHQLCLNHQRITGEKVVIKGVKLREKRISGSHPSQTRFYETLNSCVSYTM